MQSREKTLLIGLAIAAVLYALSGPVRAWLLEPFTNRYDTIASLTKTVEQKSNESLAILKAQRDLTEWKARGLPPDTPATPKARPTANVSQHLYQDWLTQMATFSGWTDVVVKPLNIGVSQKDVYANVPISVEGEARFSQLAFFLYQFRRTGLMHRISKLDIRSYESDGDPSLKIMLIAEALALKDGPKRKTLFPSSTLAVATDAETTAMEFDKTAVDFPKSYPFMMQLGTEYLVVTGMKGTTATVVRGFGGSTAQPHSEGAIAIATPVHPDMGNDPPDKLTQYLKSNIFVKPRPPIPYELEIPSSVDRVATRGMSFEYTFAPTNYDPALGKPAFQLLSTDAKDLSFDPATGKVSWKPSEDYPLGPVAVKVDVKHPSAKDGHVVAELAIEVRALNLPPTLSIDKIPPAILTRLWTLPLNLADPETAKNKLTIKLTGAPEGLTANADEGRLEWTPDEPVLPGEYPVTVAVTDNGTPPLTTTQSITITVEDDNAMFTYLVGIIAENGERQAHLFNRLRNKETIVKPGDKIEVADIHATVESIDIRAVRLKEDEKFFQLEIGQNLRERRPLPPEPKPAATEAAP